MNAELEKTHLILEAQRKKYSELPVFGKRETIEGVDCIVHIPECKEKDLPVFIELHGGAWVAGDAALVDSLCKTISDAVPCVCINLNYKKLDVHPFPYPMEEVCSVISYLITNAERYHINPDKIVICGQSAGSHIAAGSAVLAKDKGIKIARQILVYPFLDFTGKLPNPMNNNPDKENLKAVHDLFFGSLDVSLPFISPAAAKDEELCSIAPADIIICGPDELRPHGIAYYEKLKNTGVEATLKEYEEAVHGFIEVNRPDYLDDNPAKSDEQAAFARECENYIIDIMRNL